MSRDFYNLDELVQKLGRDRRLVEKLVNRGVIPGRRIAGEWRFNEIEITHWLEQDIRSLDDEGLAQFEQSQQNTELRTPNAITELLHPDTCQVPRSFPGRYVRSEARADVPDLIMHCSCTTC